MRKARVMRRFLCATVLVGGCFSPTGGDGSAGSDATTTTQTAGTMTTGTATTPTSGGVTTGSTGGTTGTGDATTGVTTIEPSTGVDPTTSTDTSTTAGTTTDPGCNPACGPCATCVAGACVPMAETTPCTPAAGACSGTLWGRVGESCHVQAASGGTCDAGGECVPKCDSMGMAIATCTDAACVLAEVCPSGGSADDVDEASFCATGGATTPDCGPICHPQLGEITIQSCQDIGACVVDMPLGCDGFSCTQDPPMCKKMCFGPQDCDAMHTCVMTGCHAGG